MPDNANVPKEHITNDQIEALFNLADEIVRAPSRFDKKFIIENLALGVADLCGVVERLGARLADFEEHGVDEFAADLAERAGIRSMGIRNGGFNMDIAEAREITAIYVAVARAMLGDAENYSETRVDVPADHVELELKLAGEMERYVFTVQRAGKVTPHEARVKAERERDDARALAVACRESIDQMPIMLSDFIGVDYEELPGWFVGYDNGREMWGGGDA